MVFWGREGGLQKCSKILFENDEQKIKTKNTEKLQMILILVTPVWCNCQSCNLQNSVEVAEELL